MTWYKREQVDMGYYNLPNISTATTRAIFIPYFLVNNDSHVNF
jgi:hypothetical protein